MGNTNLYRVVLTGKQLVGDIDKIREDILTLFDLPQAQLNALVSGKALTVKKNVPAPSAMKFKKALTGCGLECLVEPMNEDSIVNAEDLEHHRDSTPPVASAASAQKEPVRKEPASSPVPMADLVMAPAGSRLGPRPATHKKPLPDIDHLEAGSFERLSPETEEGPEPPNVDHLSVTAHDKLAPEASAPPAPPSVDHLATAEHDRLAPEPPDAPLPPKVDHIDVAEPGATLSHVKSAAPLELDLSHLKMDDNSNT